MQSTVQSFLMTLANHIKLLIINGIEISLKPELRVLQVHFLLQSYKGKRHFRVGTQAMRTISLPKCVAYSFGGTLSDFLTAG
jgi:hypothetical protein